MSLGTVLLIILAAGKTLFDMLPRFSTGNKAYRVWVNVESIAKRNACLPLCAQAANFMHIVFGKFSHAVSFSLLPLPRRLCSTFFLAIIHIVGLCAKKQMGGIAARRIVAFVKNLQPVWYRPVIEFVTDAMGKALSSVHVKYAIPLSVRSALPLPTGIRFANGDVRPKTSNRVGLGSSVRLVTGDKFHRFASDIIQLGMALFCNIGFLPTTAHAKTRRVWATLTDSLSFVVTADKSSWFAFDSSFSEVRVFCEGSWLTAAAFTEFNRGVLCGMIAHVIRSFLAVTKPGTFSASPGVVIGVLQV